jgi:hypothetical protein
LTKKVKYHRFGKRYIIQNLLLLFPLVILLAILWARWEHQDTIFWVALFLFVAVVIGGFIWDRHRLKEFHCPRCGFHIPEPTIPQRRDGDPINYYCPVCDIEWETGLFEPTSD